jgi:hypothetical protein
MESGLKALFGPRVQVRVVERFSGSSAAYSLRAHEVPLGQPVSVAQLLIRCSVSSSDAKSAVERINETGSTILEFPAAPADIQLRLAELGVEAVTA